MVIFLILSAAEAVCAITCASLPVVGPQIFKEYRAHHTSSGHKRTTTSNSTKLATKSNSGKGFHKLGGDSGELSDETQIIPPELAQDTQNAIPLSTTNVETPAHAVNPIDDRIVVKSEVLVTRGEDEEYDMQQMGKAM